jgi:RNA polymerase sigma-70 factor (ECF subfamily)
MSADLSSGHETLETVFARHRDRLLAMVARRLDPALSRRLDPQDVVQEAYLRARKKWEWFDTRGRLVLSETSWLYRLTRDCLIEAWRRESGPFRDLRKEMAVPDESSMHLGLGLIDGGTSPSAAVAREELRSRVRQTVNMLKTVDREVLWMRHLDSLSFKEIAEVAEITENAAHQRHFRAVERFMQLWESLQPKSESA